MNSETKRRSDCELKAELRRNEALASRGRTQQRKRLKRALQVAMLPKAGYHTMLEVCHASELKKIEDDASLLFTPSFLINMVSLAFASHAPHPTPPLPPRGTNSGVESTR